MMVSDKRFSIQYHDTPTAVSLEEIELVMRMKCLAIMRDPWRSDTRQVMTVAEIKFFNSLLWQSKPEQNGAGQPASRAG